MSDSVRPYGWQPIRLLCPWDSPGKDTGAGCHFLLQCRKVKSESEVAQSCPTQRPHGLQPTRLLSPQDFPGKSAGVGCHRLLRVLVATRVFLLLKTSLCSQCTVRSNKLKHQNLEQIKVYCRTKQGKLLVCPQKYPQLLKGFHQSIF